MPASGTFARTRNWPLRCASRKPRPTEPVAGDGGDELCDADKGNHTSGLFLIAAKGVELSSIASGAAADNLHMRGLHACGDQLTPVCCSHIDPPGFLQTELARDLATNLIAAD